MQYLQRFLSTTATSTGNNQFPTTDFKKRNPPRLNRSFLTTDFKMRNPPIFSSIAEKFMRSPNKFYYEEDVIKEEEMVKEEDRISELPLNIIDCIFDQLPIRDAARTTILSRNWRHIWASYPQLVFDENFFNEISIKKKHFLQSDFTKAINKALLFHRGPILKFILHIPNVGAPSPEKVDEWMLFLSRNGIKELEIDNSNMTPYIVPSCIFSCSLSDLKLRNCSLKPPIEFNGFNHLVNLELVTVSMSETLLRNTPLLKKFSLICCCTDAEKFISFAPRLSFFCLLKSGKVDWQWIANKKQLKYVRIELRNLVENDDPSVNMMKFLKNIPKVEELYLNGFSLKYLGTSDPRKHKDLIRSSITHIMIRDFRFDDINQISSVLCLLKSCPGLMTLKFEATFANYEVIEPDAELLEQLNYMDVSLDMLQMVSIKFMKGIEAELLLIKLLLARSTCLQKMIIQQSSAVCASDCFKISSEISSFSRASSSTEIIYVDPPAAGE